MRSRGKLTPSKSMDIGGSNALTPTFLKRSQWPVHQAPGLALISSDELMIYDDTYALTID